MRGHNMVVVVGFQPILDPNSIRYFIFYIFGVTFGFCVFQKDLIIKKEEKSLLLYDFTGIKRDFG